jgi:hypothetical protein
MEPGKDDVPTTPGVRGLEDAQTGPYTGVAPECMTR